MGFAQAAAARLRPIEGAVATLGVSDRVTFLRKTYAHLGVALIAFAATTAIMMRYMTEFSLRFAAWTWEPRSFHWILILVGFIGGNILCQRLALSQRSRGIQYAGLAVAIFIWSLLLQPMIWYAMIRFGNAHEIFAADGVHAALSAKAAAILGEAAIITLAIFIGLTATVFITRKDFSFLRGALSMGMFAVLGIAIASWIFGFQLGALYSGVVILLLGGYILYETSLVMGAFPPTAYVAAALMLFTTVVTLFIYVLDIVMRMNRRN